MKEDLKTKAAPVAKLTIIDEDGFWRGVAPDTPEVRAKLRAKGFDVTPGLASKQYINFDADGKRKKERSE